MSRRRVAGRRRNGSWQNDVDHLLFYRPASSPLVARRPRRFQLYDRARHGVLPKGSGVKRVMEDDGVLELLDHDPLLVELIVPRPVQ